MVLDNFQLHQLVSFPTHFTNNRNREETRTCLDLLIVGDRRLLNEIGGAAPIENHHSLMFGCLNGDLPLPVRPKIKIRLWSQARWDLIFPDLLDANLDNLVESAPSVSEAQHQWTEAFIGIIDRHIPQKTIRPKANTFWVSPALKRLIKEKNAAFVKWRKTTNAADRYRFKRQNDRDMV